MKSPTPIEVRAARRARGLTQTQAAEVVYRKLRTWQQYEHNEARMDPAVWEQNPAMP